MTIVLIFFLLFNSIFTLFDNCELLHAGTIVPWGGMQPVWGLNPWYLLQPMIIINTTQKKWWSSSLLLERLNLCSQMLHINLVAQSLSLKNLKNSQVNVSQMHFLSSRLSNFHQHRSKYTLSCLFSSVAAGIARAGKKVTISDRDFIIDLVRAEHGSIFSYECV